MSRTLRHASIQLRTVADVERAGDDHRSGGQPFEDPRRRPVETSQRSSSDRGHG